MGFDALGAELILFWRVVRRPSFHFCDRLTDLLLVFDVYDRKIKKFYNIERRNLLARQFDLHTVPLLFKGHTTLPILKELVTTRYSPYREAPLEGVVKRREAGEWLEARTKLVNPEFT